MYLKSLMSGVHPMLKLHESGDREISDSCFPFPLCLRFFSLVHLSGEEDCGSFLFPSSRTKYRLLQTEERMHVKCACIRQSSFKLAPVSCFSLCFSRVQVAINECSHCRDFVIITREGLTHTRPPCQWSHKRLDSAKTPNIHLDIN